MLCLLCQNSVNVKKAKFPNFGNWHNKQMHTVSLLFQPLPKAGIQKFGMYNLAKAYRSIQNPFPIAESRTGKPAMVTLKIQLDCSIVHDTTLWTNMYVRSHLGCGTDSVFIHFWRSHKYLKDAKAMQISSSINPPNNRGINQGILNLWSKLGDYNLNRWWVIAQTNLVTDGVTDGRTDASNDNTRRPKLASGENTGCNHIFMP